MHEREGGGRKEGGDGIFTVTTATNSYRAHAVVLALGRAGEPRKLGVIGEELPKVMYRLIEVDHYVNNNILIVGGGDSAIKEAMGLANQSGNRVTLSYQQERFSRIKERNTKRIEDCMRTGKVRVLFKSDPVEFKITASKRYVNLVSGWLATALSSSA